MATFFSDADGLFYINYRLSLIEILMLADHISTFYICLPLNIGDILLQALFVKERLKQPQKGLAVYLSMTNIKRFSRVCKGNKQSKFLNE